MTVLPSPRLLPINAADRAFVDRWLSRPEISNQTRRSNEKEAERFLMWCASQQLGLRDVTHDHLTAYWAFLANPEPAAYWVQPTKFRRTDERWRPFAGPLTLPSQRQAQAVILGMLSYAEKLGHLPSDPGELQGVLKVHRTEKVERFLPQAALPYLVKAVDALPSSTVPLARAKARARFLLLLFYGTAARLSEVASARMCAIEADERGAWWFHVIGKGGAPGQMPVHDELLDAFMAYRVEYGLPPLPEPGETIPLVLTSRGEPRGMTHYAVYDALRRILKTAAKLADDDGAARLSARIAKASTHWLRHTSITHQVDAGLQLKVVQKNARHADIKMTGRYVHKDDDDRHDETLGTFRLPG